MDSADIKSSNSFKPVDGMSPDQLKMRIQQLELECLRLQKANTDLAGEKENLVQEYEERLAGKAIDVSKT